ncbi:3-hydroxybutyryl-CoA dehydrogenase [Secundilactobacillus odoratitofui DSM 19909 = JCM 15043]|uniref:L-gulonate 3-dehydrogenase n=1 Tax=Secundilactobacillus odoratitofui DSM 19909 = JCM 15043 TaxID=1423776 RepID=A0A0R1LY65_9LACO|nr:3-hydroxyacyl-CoA dehydrogenase family protein [Secundilactobacillus odoratitofui]KRK97865.1 3-hydroxybutyryl-CoA dehydrogenase [Secundilactobacillus odoratitofui DSM 19909 = JCM 15043]
MSETKVITNIGAGTMGHAIALQFAMNGYNVNLLETSSEALKRGLKLIEADLETFNHAGILTDFPNQIMARIHPTTSYELALNDTEFVIESVVEDMAVKKQVWAEVEKYVKPETILATNTSGLDPTEMQADLDHPERLVVAHFWNPAQLMPLVEVVPGQQTDQSVVDQTVTRITQIGKHAVPLKKVALGFVGNRIQLAVLREALHIVDEGIATPEAVDEIIKTSLGLRWSLVGPIASADLGGLDVFKKISDYLYADLANQTDGDPLLSKMVAEGHLGLKSGSGFYDWQGDAGQQVVAQRDEALLAHLKDDVQPDTK